MKLKQSIRYQLADFIGHHSKPFSGFPGTRSLNGSI